LRDEFTFRCAYCLKRETWGQATGEFELDHFQPQSIAPHHKLDYFNLIYACRRCNAAKLDGSTDDPSAVLSRVSIKVRADGTLSARSADAHRLIQQLDLNSPKLRNWRVMWMRIVDLASEHDPALEQRLTGFPDELPDLGRLRPPKNTRPDGIELSWFAKRRRGQLPDRY
jgi:hypothetical protein